jgi:hypothetical protein
LFLKNYSYNEKKGLPFAHCVWRITNCGFKENN